jgi:3-deoxy-D-manno-octulosonate 8-phosphate phosphatase (KDO 8-P phosphatase)
MPVNNDLRQQVDLIVFDFDGVLTDNSVFVFEDGREAVRCSRADGLAFDMFRAAEIPAVIMSTEHNTVVTARAKKLKLPVVQAIVDKAAAIRTLVADQELDLARIMFIGNDLNDLPALSIVGWPVAVADSHERVRQASRIILQTKGGSGVAREVAESLFGLGFN